MMTTTAKKETGDAAADSKDEHDADSAVTKASCGFTSFRRDGVWTMKSKEYNQATCPRATGTYNRCDRVSHYSMEYSRPISPSNGNNRNGRRRSANNRSGPRSLCEAMDHPVWRCPIVVSLQRMMKGYAQGQPSPQPQHTIEYEEWEGKSHPHLSKESHSGERGVVCHLECWLAARCSGMQGNGTGQGKKN
ncbi:hypothetical protein F442_10371 [Phytophthora nicotianae P10297]|uniref:Uncharacterized protein n=1 Tax=Phytophthora nicotianae P10297 TaxID=1317064 RepID=W2Z977_PHYNI|nr:hypothetical protein F442_10371 [Phytophthora nicotianae P10297]